MARFSESITRALATSGSNVVSGWYLVPVNVNYISVEFLSTVLATAFKVQVTRDAGVTVFDAVDPIASALAEQGDSPISYTLTSVIGGRSFPVHHRMQAYLPKSRGDLKVRVFLSGTADNGKSVNWVVSGV